jgi:hypothetical protein
MEPLVLRCRIEGAGSEVDSHADARTVAWAIQRLDGRRYNDLIVEPDGPDSLSVSGGLNGRCLVGLHERGGEMIWYAAEPERGDELEENIVGGQETDLPARWWVTMELALKAAAFFFHHLARDPGLVWEQDPGLAQMENGALATEPERSDA